VAKSNRRCDRCGRPIPAERVEALPDTQVCVGCAEAMGGSEFDVLITPERVNKAESYKRRYGGIEVVKVRKPI
jgi:RNA polymerase-binding transcription factor DksA